MKDTMLLIAKMLPLLSSALFFPLATGKVINMIFNVIDYKYDYQCY